MSEFLKGAPSAMPEKDADDPSNYWGVTKVLSKIWSGRRIKFVRTREVETPFPRRFLLKTM